MNATEPSSVGGRDPADERDPVERSKRYLDAVRAGKPGRARRRLAAITDDGLVGLAGDERLAFWINTYNAATQDALRADPERFEHRRRFFSAPITTVAGTEVSLDTIEHGVLRRSRWKYGLGYLPNPFPSAFVRRHRVDELDPRIHFALNCGAASCPSITAYEPETVDERLDHATATYLRNETVLEDGTVRVPRQMLWYHGDFGGASGIRRRLREHGVIDASASPRIRYRGYDWALLLDAFRDEPRRS